MTDLEQRVSSALQRLAANTPAETEPVEQLRRRVHRRRARRASGTAFALLLAVALVAGVATLHHSGSGATTPQPIRVGAPDLLLGDIDAVVVSSRFDADGARAQIPVSVLYTVSRVPGVQVASGVLQEFATITDRPPSAPPRTPIVFSYHEPDELHLLRGRLPQANNEIVANADFLQRETATVGQTVTVRLQQTTRPFTIVGEFDLPQGSTAGIPLLAVAATQSLGVSTIDRVDVKVAAGADPEQVRARIAAALGGGYAAISPTSLGYGDQRLAQLGIQHAYWSLLSPDPNERHAASESTQDPAKADATYAQHASETAQAELRVENVAFVSPDAATLTYRIYYDGVPSPYIPAPQAGAAVRVDGVWKIASSTACALANLTATPCAGQENAPTPPAGWKTRVDTRRRCRPVVPGAGRPRGNGRRTRRRGTRRHETLGRDRSRPAGRPALGRQGAFRDRRVAAVGRRDPRALRAHHRRRRSGDALPAARLHGAPQRSLVCPRPVRLRAAGVGEPDMLGRRRPHHRVIRRAVHRAVARIPRKVARG